MKRESKKFYLFTLGEKKKKKHVNEKRGYFQIVFLNLGKI